MNSTIANWRESKKIYSLLGYKGTIISLTIINNSGSSLKSPAQFIVALVKMENSMNLILPLVSESDDPKIGDKVTTVLRRVKTPTKSEIIEYGLKFKKIK